ncbi:TetR family transcriptional regulator [Streptomyces radicis]|uniref:TetR/AcrR family transcriptional regulator n=1 Tax=Streptomyces radicis TaxID=1750517 RepID=A0A3A9WV86_9ACTN|nr:TetR family transcriptional regulator [Streptomyces radicis]RKN10027.1 TetR/AcrR family transcriptional regulator [Streptomyces radicis]RKN24368.1 TetR/AcrR family transcriptional regulator [Streptomyces radicis]
MNAPTPGKPTRRRGRPSRAEAAEGTPGTRDRILTSARAEFAERGYDRASIRAIARGAEVNPALVHHYFGTKEGVFAAAVAAAAAPATDGLARDERFDVEEFGERFTRLFFGIWENAATRSPLLAIVRSALNNETAARIFRGFVTAQLLGRITGGLDAPDAQLRAELAAAQLVGTVLLRYVLKIEPLASAPAEELIARLAPVVQHHLTGPGGGPLA